MLKRHATKVGLILLTALILGFLALPGDMQKQIAPFTPDFILNNKINLGLDLQGGSQLDYKVDLRKVPEKDKASVVDGILNVINRRVNGLGVSEPNIYTSDVADEKHIIVELAGIKDLDEAKKIVGKTIQLEFKEEKEGPADPKETEAIKATAQAFLTKVLGGGDLNVMGQEEAQSNPGKVAYIDETTFKFKDEIKGEEAWVNELFNLKKGETAGKLIESTGDYTVDASGQLKAGTPGYHVIKVTDRRDQEREISTPRSVKVRHILVAFKGAQRADEKVTRSEDEAKKRAEEALTKIQGGAKFEDIAKEYSDDASNKDNGGVLDQPVTGDGRYVKEFEDATNNLKAGEMSAVFKSPFGFHFLKVDEITEAKTEKKTEPQVTYNHVYFDAAPDPWKETGLNGEQFVHADVAFDQFYRPFVSIQFNDEGGKLFEEITSRNVNKPIAIFVGGQLISAPNVNEKISGGKAQISGRYTVEEARAMAQELNTGAIPAPISLAGQYSIGATLGQDALTKSVAAGVIGFILVALFMMFYYRLPGLLATVALILYVSLLLFLIKAALPLEWSLGISLVVFFYLISKALKAKDSGLEKAISMTLICFILFFLTFLLSGSITLTLAGIAGVILSIGMAVDANILIFERIKEELRDGKTLASAIEVGFDRAWNSIRDSNFSSLITCGILFNFGSSIIQGFAFNLAAGILVSMFTAITVTKTLLAALAHTKLSTQLWLFGAPKKKERKPLEIIKNRKKLYVFSVVLLVGTLIGIPLFGLKAGLDFTGGTLMELKFTNPVEMQVLKDNLTKAGEEVNKQIAAGVVAEGSTEEVKNSTAQQSSSATQQAEPTTIIAAENEKIDLSKVHIVPSENNSFMIKGPHVSNNAHDLLKAELKKNLGEFEETRYSTVGPTVGSSLQYRALFAIMIASVMIVLYVAFAFRKVPRHIGKWRFGVTAIIALVHDLAVMLGVYVYMGVIFGVEIDALFITALLTVLGFSVHDTIVVFDRIREKLKFQKKDEHFEDIANQAVNETLARSINTSFSVLLTLASLAVFGSESIRFFVISLIVGIICGTYSSVFVATPLLVDWQKWIRDKK
ncbi:protein translocase subunit SecF [Candidatus Peregrinibacteria bacterium]|nr:protein translocase subunit SecF [Candidatus Peregrinibacteria bacterium]